MNWKYIGVLLLGNTAAITHAQDVHQYDVQHFDTLSYNVYQIPLKSALSHSFEVKATSVQFPQGKILAPTDYSISYGTARKQKTAFLSIPKYISHANNIDTLHKVDITVYNGPALMETDAKAWQSSSVLATGTWYKIAVDKRGVFKIDYNFLQSLGVNPATINPQNVRLYGNGGKILNEAVDTTVADDLVENALFMSANGNTFGTNDYLLFYADGLTNWEHTGNHIANHKSNIYEDQAYYFINFDLGPGKRITTEQSPTVPSLQTINQYYQKAIIDYSDTSLSQIGKVWWGNQMNALDPASRTKRFTYPLGNPTGEVQFESVIGAYSANTSSNFTITHKGQNVYNKTFPAIGDMYNIFIRPDTARFNVMNTGNTLDLTFNYNLNGPGSAFFDYIKIGYNNALQMWNSQLIFDDFKHQSLLNGGVYNFQISNASAAHRVWNIENPLQPTVLQTSLSGNVVTVKDTFNEGKSQWVAFSDVYTPKFIGNIPNQNLHGLTQYDYIIITDPKFKTAANALADYRRTKSGVSAIVVTKDEIYNEFSSGGQDIVGIRNFIKMFYDRAANANEVPKGVVFIGAASYDFKDKIANNTNYIPTHQSDNSYYMSHSLATDDFYALLDDGESMSGTWMINNNLLDVAIGRIPAYSEEDVYNAIAKIKIYESAASFGPWKNNIAYVADDKDVATSMNHLNDCESVNVAFSNDYTDYNVLKLYADAHNKVNLASGVRYPTVNKAISDNIFNGVLMLSYSGHGSPVRWADEAILTETDIKSWNNETKLPLLFTGTCDFGRFDNPSLSSNSKRSAGVDIFNKKVGGAIALITTTQQVTASGNTSFNKNYVASQFAKLPNGAYKTLGEAVRVAKNDNRNSASFYNNLMYVLLGDPLLKLSIPEDGVVTDSLVLINDNVETLTDTMNGFGIYKISGHINDLAGNFDPNFNGKVYLSIFDKEKLVNTVNNTPQTSPNYKVQNNTVAKVSGEVKNGLFTVQFVIPRDIMLDYGKAKILYYAHSDEKEVKGVDTNIVLGGVLPNVAVNEEGPIVQAYIDDERFRPGTVTSANPMLYVKLYDDNGINISGSAIGHDLVAVLDDDVANPFILNEFYQTAANSYQEGYVYFPMSNLAPGEHTIKVKAWDTHNNSGEGSVSFVVGDTAQHVIGNLYTYPNPTAGPTTFVIPHNLKGKTGKVTVTLYETSGKLIMKLDEELTFTQDKVELKWDGNTERGQALNAGVYIYTVLLTTEEDYIQNSNKLVIIK